jgi:hypothetical protein
MSDTAQADRNEFELALRPKPLSISTAMSCAQSTARTELASMKTWKAPEKSILWQGRHLEPSIDDQYAWASRKFDFLEGLIFEVAMKVACTI